MKKNVVEDEEAPAYFSQRAIYVFSILFGVLFGSILMCINLNKTDTKKGTVIVVVFGVIYTAIEIAFLNTVNAHTAGTYLCNALGAVGLNYIFWNKYIGKDTAYRAKPVWIPTVVGVCVVALFLLAMFCAGGLGSAI